MLDAARGWLLRVGDSRARLRVSRLPFPRNHATAVLREAADAAAVSEYVIKRQS